MYQLKLLQLIGIQEQNEASYLQINMKLDQEATFYWQVDKDTANRLSALTDFSKGYFYRLSLKTTKNKSSITRNFRDQSVRMDFTCSDAYSKALAELKQIQSIADLDKLPFVSLQSAESSNLAAAESTNATLLENESEKAEARPEAKKRKFLRPLFTTLIIFSAIVFAYSGHSLLTNASALTSTTANADNPTNQNAQVVKEKGIPKPETLLLEENIKIEEIPEAPVVEVGDGVASHVPDGMVALTFDDGPSQFSSEIVDILKQFGAGGTFFSIGVNVDKYPDQLNYVADNGFTIGTHTMHHANLAISSKAEQEKEILASIQEIKDVTGQDIVLFRPPYGNMNDTTEQIANAYGKKIVLWNNDTRDWESHNAAKILEHIKSTEVSGSIILLHESKETVEALPAIIAYLQGLNLQLVTLY